MFAPPVPPLTQRSNQIDWKLWIEAVEIVRALSIPASVVSFALERPYRYSNLANWTSTVDPVLQWMLYASATESRVRSEYRLVTKL